MRIEAYLLQLRQQGIEVRLEGDRLVIHAQKGALTPEHTEALRARKPELIAFLAAARLEQTSSHPIPTITRVPRAELMPLSFTQERLWYLSQVETNPAVFNLPTCLRIGGRLDLDVLQRCLDELAKRHEVLRTTIVVRDGVGFQRINPSGGLPLTIVDLRDDAAPAERHGAMAVLDREASRPFDLEAAPPIHATLVRVADDDCYLLFVIHHMFVDGTSQAILLDELIALYDAFRAGAPSPLPPVSLQFADYAVWQRGWLQGAALEEQVTYWRERLRGAPQVLDLPTDFPRPALRESRGNKEPLRLPGEASRTLLALAHREGATPFMAMLALVNILLSRLSGQEDLLVGAPVANRGRRESENIVGYIANTLVLRTDCSGSPSFLDVVRRVREMCVGAFRHQDMPFQKIVEALRPVRDLSRTPMYQVFLTYDEVFAQPTRMGDLRLERVIVGSTVARQDMSVFLRRVGEFIEGSVEYSADLFRRDTVLRFIEQLGVLTESAAANPDVPIGALEILTPGERALLSAANATRLDVPDVAVHDMVAAQAARTPHAVALRSGGASMTYAEMMAAARQLAQRLQAQGVRPNDLVGVCVERSVDMVVSLLAVLRTGAAYVPLDPDFPAVRIAHMIEDSGLRVIVCQRSTEARMAGAGRVTVLVDAPEPAAAAADSAAPPATTPDSRAYVIYTSGSTGRPKGVELTHRNVVSFLAAMKQRPGIQEKAVLVAVTTLSFDIAVLELFLPLVTGGTVVVATRDAVTDGARLGRLMADVGATMMQATPATWRLLLDAGWTGDRTLRALCGGETFPSELASRLLPMVGELWNMYGPTETTVWSLCARITDVTSAIPIGSPIANTMFRVVDKNGRQVPLGVPGELLIGGPGVAKGYLGREDLTAEKFVVDPQGDGGTARAYRTGDLVRVLSDGMLQHLGRFDDQVKVRGHRIELGEIDAALATMPEVREAVVAVHGKGDTDARLVGYVVYRAGQHATVSEIRKFLRDLLPQYMVPGMIIEIDRIPRTPNGKVDRRQLPDPRGATPTRQYVAPANELEQLVSDAWSASLSVERVGRHDNFFDLGGHSLLSMRVVAAIEQRTGVRIDPRLMFFQTLEQIAAHVGASPVRT